MLIHNHLHPENVCLTDKKKGLLKAYEKVSRQKKKLFTASESPPPWLVVATHLPLDPFRGHSKNKLTMVSVLSLGFIGHSQDLLSQVSQSHNPGKCGVMLKGPL